MKHLYEGTVTAEITVRDADCNDKKAKLIFNNAIVQLENRPLEDNMTYCQSIESVQIESWSSIEFEIEE